jgi:hypothetical protein
VKNLSERSLWKLCLVVLIALLTCQSFSQAQPQAPAPAPAAPDEGQCDDQPLPGDWGPELLYAILSSPNDDAEANLYRAAFAAGPDIIPQLQEALKDDRTAEFAAKSLALIGGEKAMKILWSLQTDPRDLDLRRFYYGALAEFRSPQADKILLDVVKRADAEGDRTVTEAAIVGLTVRSDPSLVPKLEEIEKQIQDVVIKLDIENATSVITQRAKYLATPEGKKAGGSIEEAVRTYFMPALMPPPSSGTASGSHGQRAKDPSPPVKVEAQQVTLSLNKDRAYAQVTFEDPTAIAYYDIVLQKELGNWRIASVWLGPEIDKNPPLKVPTKPGKRQHSEP